MEDAHIILAHYHQRPLPIVDRAVGICQIMLALVTVQRHLPAPRQHGIEHYLWLGRKIGRGATYLPHRP